MSQPKKDCACRKVALVMAGVFCLILGITLVLTWWQDVVILFRGLIGMALALAGMLVLYALNQ